MPIKINQRGEATVPEDSVREVDTSFPAEVAGEQEHAMLEVALTPTSIALCGLDDSLGGLFVAALQIVGHPYLPSGPPQQACLDKVMREDVTTKRFSARQFGQVTIFHEGTEPDNGVVAPEVSSALLPESQPFHKNRAVETVRELLHATEERLPIYQNWRSLDERNAGI